jgi:YbbR domain-containing protein
VEIQLIRRVRKGWSRLFGHLGTLFLSILMGLIVWLIATNQENPLTTHEYAEKIPIRLHGLADALLPTHDLSKESVRLTLRAPQSSWNNLEINDINAYVDLTGMQAGVHDVPVQVDVSDPNVKVIGVQREQLRIQLDPVITKTVPIHVEIQDAPAFGFDTSPPVLNPATVLVRGPASQVAQVSSADAQIYLRSAQNQVERVQTVTLVDAQRQPVEGVAYEPRLVNITVPVERWPGRKEVAVRINLQGQPAPGYRLSTVKLDPATVVLRGDGNALNQVPGFVETAPMSLAGATADLHRQITLTLPSGVTAFEGNTVSVIAGIAPVESTRTIKVKPILRGLGSNLKARIALDTVDVIVSGPLTMLGSLGADDLFVKLDLTDLVSGTHIISSTVVLPPGVRQVGVLPSKVEVVITNAPTPNGSGAGTIPTGPTSAAIKPPGSTPTP